MTAQLKHEGGVIKHEGDVIKHEKPAGSIINQGDLLASLTLADPSRVKKIGAFSGTLEYATGEEMVTGSATLKRFRKAQKTLELVMDGYVLDAEPAVQAMLSALASVSLPIEEIKDAASALGQKMPMELDTMMQKVYATTLAEHVNGMDSTETATLVTKLRAIVEEYVKSLFESKQADVRIIIAPVTAQIDKYAKGLRENAIDVTCTLLTRYVNVESTFVDMSTDLAVGASAFAHEQLKGRNLLVISMMGQLSGFPERFGVEPLGTLPPSLNVVVTLSQMPGAAAAYKEVALTVAKFGLMKAEEPFDEAVSELKAELKSEAEVRGATSTPFDGDELPLRGSRQPVLGALVLLRLCGMMLVYAVCTEQERSSRNRNTHFVIWSKNNHPYQHRWVIVALLALIVPGVSAMATTVLLDGDGTGAAHRTESVQMQQHRTQQHRAESVQMQPPCPPPPTQCAGDVNRSTLDASGAPLPCSYFGAQPSACASYSIARTVSPVACGTCPPDPPGVVFNINPGSLGVVQEIGLNFIRGVVQVRVAETSCELPIAPMGRLLTCLPRLTLAQLRPTLWSTTACTCRRYMNFSPIPP